VTEFLGSLLVHSDSGRALLAAKRLGLGLTSDDLVGSLLQLAADIAEKDSRELVFPAFNYDFGVTRSFDVENDPVQVGGLPERLRAEGRFTRTPVPFFSFLYEGTEFSTDFENLDPFGAHSVFDLISGNAGSILMLGVGLEAFTFIHHIESSVPGGPVYRYRKRFSGVVQRHGNQVSCTVEMHVRPKGFSIDYDWPRLQAELFEVGALRFLERTGPLILVSATGAKDYLLGKLAENPLHLLTRKNQAEVAGLLHGRERLSIEQFE